MYVRPKSYVHFDGNYVRVRSALKFSTNKLTPPTIISSMTSRICRRLYSFKPPSHFGDPYNLPNTFQGKEIQINETVNTNERTNTNDKNDRDRTKPIKEITSLLSMCALTYIAVDNYTNRIKLEMASVEIAAINQRTLQSQKIQFINTLKKRDLQILQERREMDRRNFKMSLHIALLRKQLLDSGISPLEIESAVKEFEKNVRIDNSSRNVSGQALWLDDGSELKSFTPDCHEYDKKQESIEK